MRLRLRTWLTMPRGRWSVEAAVDGGHRIREPRLLGVQERRDADARRVAAPGADARMFRRGSNSPPGRRRRGRSGRNLPRPPLLFRD